MIPLSKAFDLGADTTRIKDPRDAARQTLTAQTLLERLFNDDFDKRWELQLLADEVGMGKTFVALAVAYSVLDHQRAGGRLGDLEGCYKKVVILTPPNASLLTKWYREVMEFVTRCVHADRRAEAKTWFKPEKCDRLDTFVAKLRQGGRSARVLVAPMDIFGEKKLRDYDVKRKFLLGALFRYWGNRLQLDRRERLLKGAPTNWPTSPSQLSSFTDAELAVLPCEEEEALKAIQHLDRRGSEGEASPIEALWEVCRSISEPYVRNRDELFKKVSDTLNWMYREMVLSLIDGTVPLVIVDEAHNWKNGPTSGANGYELFARYLAARCRRALLLTATPFQLRPQEMLELLKIGEALQPAPERSGAHERRERFRTKREETLAPVLDQADRASRHFAKAWSKIAHHPQSVLAAGWAAPALMDSREQILVLADRVGPIPTSELTKLVAAGTKDVEPGLRSFFIEALTLFAHNRDLSSELGPLVVRHRRQTEHRLVRVGHEYGSLDSAVVLRPDRHVLHAAAGLDVHGEAELPHYLLMRCFSETKSGKGRTSLGSALTGCYSTLLDSSDGKRIKDWLAAQPAAAGHFDLLLGLVHREKDPTHPKISVVVEEVLQAWRRGEKTLLFCFRTNTAERLHELILDRISKELDVRRKKCLGGVDSLRALRGRLTRRDGDLIPLVLDRVLWSLLACNAMGEGIGYTAEDLTLHDEDVAELARVCVMFGIDLDEEKADRVFLARAVEHVVALRLMRTAGRRGLVAEVLRSMVQPGWVEWPYGLSQVAADSDEAGMEEAFQTRGVHTHYPVKLEHPDLAKTGPLTERIEQRRRRARTTGEMSVFDTDAEGPSLWFGGSPRAVPESQLGLVGQIHEHLALLSRHEEGLDWESRRVVFEALRRTLLRESVLVRLLPSRSDRSERAWGELLVEAFWTAATGTDQHESMAHRIEVFLEDLRGATGPLSHPETPRATLIDATRLRDHKFVALVKGGDQKGRERVFAGFNTPLLPDVLVCTSVGAEGIDLHRHCRHVVHYDLAWNPAVLEQRTGRVDRIGSKTFRERKLTGGRNDMFLEVGVPFLAGTYDERMYEELRVRAQTFEVLTGGEVSADNIEGQDDVADAEGRESEVKLAPLPMAMVEDLRVQLQVWNDLSGGR